MENWHRPAADHFDGDRFFNPSRKGGHPGSLLWDILPGTGRVSPVTPKDAGCLPSPALGQVVLTFVNHATFLIQTDVGNILTDPVWAARVGHFDGQAPHAYVSRASSMTRCRPFGWFSSATITTIISTWQLWRLSRNT